MEEDEITYNAFYHLLRNKYRQKYELALSKCWTICVPCGDALRGLTITDSFVDDHILKPHSEIPLHFISTDENNSLLFKFEDTTIQLVACDEKELVKTNSQPKVNVLSVERGYNKEFLMYNILILDVPLHPKYRAQKLPQDKMKLNRGITCYKEALEFLNEFSEEEKSPLDKLRVHLNELDLNGFESAEELCSNLQELTKRYWANMMRKQTLDLQRDARFQKLLSTSLEVFIMHFLHDRIYSLLGNALEQEDLYVRKKVNQLVDRRVTPDQLGADESLAISLPAAIVELATLDAREGPLEKILCLRSTLDLIVAEIKGALAEVQTESDEIGRDFVSSTTDPCKNSPSTDDFLHLLIYVIVRARPKRLVTDLHYIHNFLWSISPYDGLSYSLVTFETAVSALYRIDVQNLPPRSHKVKTELPICELLDIISGHEKDITPLDRQIHQLANMLEKSTQNQELLI